MAIFLLYERSRQDKEPLLPFVLFRDRNFSVINFVGVAVSFGVVGLFLPTTIYLQSVLGFTALKSGLVLLPLALGSIIMAGPAGALSDRIGGKYILMAGLLGFGGGVAWLVQVAEVDRSWTALVGPLLLVGLGAGCTFAPMAAEVMRNVPARLSGAASGVNNALRQFGSVLAGAVVGAVLQAQLSSSLREQAQVRADQLPAEYRSQFIDGFANAGQGGLEFGAGTSGAERFSADMPQAVAGQLRELSGQVFGHGFADAMGPTMGVSIGVLFAGAIACLIVTRHRGASANPHGLPVSEPEPVDATVRH